MFIGELLKLESFGRGLLLFVLFVVRRRLSVIWIICVVFSVKSLVVFVSLRMCEFRSLLFFFVIVYGGLFCMLNYG